MTIAILGATGDIGSALVRQLARAGIGPLRLGSRKVAASWALAEGLFPAAIGCRAVDAGDAASLSDFLADCRLLVNCAGPSHHLAPIVAKAAARAGIDLVDVAGDAGPAIQPAAGRVSVLAAGLQPGLTGLLPRWLAEQRFDRVERLSSHFGVLDLFTPIAAADYLAAANDGTGQANAGWRDGRVQAGCLTRREGIALPGFAGPVTALPFLSAESARLAAWLRLDRGDWFNIVAGRHMLAAFDRALALPQAVAVESLCRASRLDLAGKRPGVTLALEMAGMRDGQRETASALLQGPGNAALTAAMALVAIKAVLAGKLPPGRHMAADILNPADSLPALLSASGSQFRVTDGPLAALAEEEEGAL